MKGKSTRSLHRRPVEFAVAAKVHTYPWWKQDRERAERRAEYDRSHPVPPKLRNLPDWEPSEP